MDHSSIPTCAQYRNTGTVIVRLKMEVTTCCCKPEECPKSGCPDLVHRPSGCEQCSRTRLISRYSDCDSDVVEKSRPYRSSAARSRYVNVCAAVCLLLLVCGLSPRSSAAPHRSRASMERQRRDTDEENSLWANPCDYNDSQSKLHYPPTKEVALKLVRQAKNTFSSTEKYKDTFAYVLHSYSKFEELLGPWESSEYLPKEWLPKEKVLYHQLPDEYINQLMPKLDELLPGMYKGLKMIVGGLNKFSEELSNTNISTDESLKSNITQSMHDVRAVLCYFNDIMHVRNLKIEKLLESEIPDLQSNMGALLYRDTLNYLEYLTQVFQKVYDTESA
ncbi:hypothetical protein SFRURICE_000355 [Spodoptera frugiperda]|nr:hypothetical protein SFRURICE_000355 [Spodoptera frugiperda]